MELQPLLQYTALDLTTLWNAALGDHFPMRLKLFSRNVFGDLNFVPEASFAAVKDGRLVGFVVSKLNREFIGALTTPRGYINSLIVHPDFQRQGIGTALLKRAVEALKPYGLKKIAVGTDTFHFFPGVPTDCPAAKAFFAKAGADFEDRLATDLVSDIRHFELPDSVKATLARENVEIRPCRPDEVELTAKFFHDAFPGRWQYEFHKFIYDGGDPADVMIVREADRVIGFCHIYTPESVWIGPNVYWAPLFPNERFGGYGPLGVLASERKRGLGLAVVACAVAELQRRGITMSGVDWTELVDFYGKLGFTPWKQYWLAEFRLAK